MSKQMKKTQTPKQNLSMFKQLNIFELKSLTGIKSSVPSTDKSEKSIAHGKTHI